MGTYREWWDSLTPEERQPYLDRFAANGRMRAGKSQPWVAKRNKSAAMRHLISTRNAGNQHALGHRHTDEARARMRAAQLARHAKRKEAAREQHILEEARRIEERRAAQQPVEFEPFSLLNPPPKD